MSIISKEACFRYPNCTVDDVHDTLAQVYTSDDLQEASRCLNESATPVRLEIA